MHGDETGRMHHKTRNNPRSRTHMGPKHSQHVANSQPQARCDDPVEKLKRTQACKNSAFRRT